MNHLLPILLSLQAVTAAPGDDLEKVRDSVRGRKATITLKGGTYFLDRKSVV